MKTFVINLQRAVERKKHMQRQLNRFSFLDAEFIDAVDGKQFSADVAKSLFDYDSFYKLYGRDPSLAEIGCTFSHIKCYKKLIDSEEKAALILEDDAYLSERLDIIKKIEIDDTPQLILLTPRFSFSFRIRKIAAGFSLNKFYFGSCATGYIINKTAAKIICSLAHKPYWVADDWLLMKKHFNLYGIVPPLVYWDEGLETQIQTGEKKSTNIVRLLLSPVALSHKILKIIGHYSK